MGYYLETTDEKVAIQITNFASKIGGYAAAFGLTAAETASSNADAAYYAWSVTNYKKIDTYKKNWTSFKNILLKGESNVTSNTAPTAPALDTMPAAVAPGILIRFTTLVNRIKAHQNYTTAIGQNLGIEMTAAHALNKDNVKPVLTIVTRGGVVNILWKKKGYSGILIEKDSGSGFMTLDKDFHPDFIDNSPLPEEGKTALWKYRAIYLHNDEKVGQWSDIVSSTVKN